MTWVICFNELDSPGHWNKFLNLASDWEKKLKAHTMCQSIVLGQREREKRKTCWIKTCQNISEWCIFGSRFVNDSSGFFQLSFLLLSSSLPYICSFRACHLGHDVCETGLRDWSKLCAEVSPIFLVPATHAYMQQFPHPFNSCRAADFFCLSWAFESRRHSL